MATFTVEVHDLNDTKVLQGVTVTAKFLDFFGNDKQKQEITDSKGIALFNIGVFQTDIEVTASKSGSIDKATVFINIIGQAEPDRIVMNLAFKPLEGIQDNITGLVKFTKEQAKVLIIITGIVIGVGAIIFIASKARSTSLPSPNQTQQVKEKTKSTVSKVKSKFPNLKK